MGALERIFKALSNGTKISENGWFLAELWILYGKMLQWQKKLAKKWQWQWLGASELERIFKMRFQRSKK
jgi:hypothetical protein